MSLYKYAQACTGFELELKESLTREDITELRKDCAALGLKAWYSWTSENLPSISAYIAATPSQRQKRKAWKDPAVKRFLVLGALYEVQCAKNLLKGLVQHEHNLIPGSPYRDMAVKAAEAYREIFLQDVHDWPFDDPDPFS
ncbi:MAG: hypothetical protein JRD68_09710 [Deltaproteobacteria bacterium]|nr:hypothetical protein [Deltaproteobacteria bacterium]